MKKVYVETSVLSYLTARPSRDLVAAARQRITAEWWERYAGRFALHVSEIVIREASLGNLGAASARLAAASGLPVLAASVRAEGLASGLIAERALPAKALDDAAHIAVATVHGMDFLLTWNFRHIANAERREAVTSVCRAAGYEPPVICTPEELVEDDHD
jgi:hypothetical protein